MHWLIIRDHGLAKTGCGVEVYAYYPMTRAGLNVDGTVLRCTTDGSVVNCLACLDVKKSNVYV